MGMGIEVLLEEVTADRALANHLKADPESTVRSIDEDPLRVVGGHHRDGESLAARISKGG